MNRKRIVYVGQFKFPTGEAGSFRISNIANTLEHIGHEVLICTGQLSQFPSTVDSNRKSSFATNYINYSEQPKSKVVTALKYLTSGYRTIKWLDKLFPKPDAVFLYGGYSIYAAFLLPWCRKYNIPLVIDVVEWYNPSQMLGGRFGLLRWNFEFAFRYFFPKAGRIIAISKYLERHFSSKKCSVVRIPPTIDTKSIRSQTKSSSNKRLIIAYTGAPAKKDLLNNVVEAMMQLDLDGKRLCLVVAGPDAETLLRLPVLQKLPLRKLPGCVHTLGRVSHEKALEVVRAADFSVLLRPTLRYAQAGFPTKVPESLAVGTPVICNITSDLGEHIANGREGLICKSYSVDDFKATLKIAMNLTPDQKSTMRRAARLRAEKSFDFRNYSISLNEFLRKAMAKKGNSGV